MVRTFREMFDRLGPERRARVVFGIDRMHRDFLAANGGRSGMPYDIAEYLTDESIIEAYLAEVRQTADPELLRQAYAAAERARKRRESQSGAA